MRDNARARPLNICMGSIRQAHYTGPLDVAASSFYDLYKRFAAKHAQYKFSYFNAVSSGERPRVDFDVLKDCDVFLIVLENEHQYTNNRINPLFRGYLDERLKTIRKLIKGKTVVILNSDILHTPELIYNKTLKRTPRDIHWICENDFRGNIHAMKYWNTRFLYPRLWRTKKTIDFAYWGSYRDRERNDVLRAIKRNPRIKSLYVGQLPPFTDVKWTRRMSELLPTLAKARSTVCFPVPSRGDWLTARVHEAMGLRIVPFVWGEYDTNDVLKTTAWQRVSSVEELEGKIIALRDDRVFARRFSEILKRYEASIMTPEQIYKQWDRTLMKVLKDASAV